jgi:hypothetical protein
VAGEEPLPAEVTNRESAVVPPDVRALPPGQNLIHVLFRYYIRAAELVIL